MEDPTVGGGAPGLCVVLRSLPSPAEMTWPTWGSASAGYIPAASLCWYAFSQHSECAAVCSSDSPPSLCYGWSSHSPRTDLVLAWGCPSHCLCCGVPVPNSTTVPGSHVSSPALAICLAIFGAQEHVLTPISNPWE